jgi:hypothetical protein
MGASGMGGAGLGGSLGLDDVDLTLGGFNQDLPTPMHDCLDGKEYEGCVSFSGEYNGAPLDVRYMDTSVGVVLLSADSSRRVGCHADLSAEDEFFVSLTFGASLFSELPTTFELVPPLDARLATYVSFSRDRRKLLSHSDDQFVLGETHKIESRMTGEGFLGPGRSAGNTSEFTRGVFAVSLTPLPTCMPDAEGLGCDTVRLRGTFSARTLSVVVFGAEGASCAEAPGMGRCALDLECVIEPGQKYGKCAKPR